VVDIMANAAFFFGLVRVLAEQERPVWTQMSFNAAEENFHSGARHGIEAAVYWPGLGTLPAAELVLRRLLPMAAEGLDRWGVDPAERDRLLGVIQGRCVTGRNGASWQVDAFRKAAGGEPNGRADALRVMLCEYRERMHANVPVHEWNA
jgi:hypothetical protein